MENQFEERLRFFVDEFEKILNEYLGGLQLKPDVLNESVRYSLQVGGKRVRPALMFASAQMLGGKIADVSNFALALELIHTYSLIHDDLPAMDNDDFRRGKPSNHKVYGEGQAILAGDALLNEAYRICFSECGKGKSYIAAARLICENAGVTGMIAGQAADLYYQGKEGVNDQILTFIMQNKTAKMLTSAVVVPAEVYGVDENLIAILKEFGKNLGILFQITDDILDVTGDFEKMGKTLGKDAYDGKLSAVSLYGMEASREKADYHFGLCLKLLDELPYECTFLSELTRFVRERNL